MSAQVTRGRVLLAQPIYSLSKSDSCIIKQVEQMLHKYEIDHSTPCRSITFQNGPTGCALSRNASAEHSSATHFVALLI
jgi:hypothetical protein